MWTGENDTKTISVDENRSKTVPFSFENGVVWTGSKLLGWKVSVKGIHSPLVEADGSKADSLLTFWTQLSALYKVLSG